VSTLARKIVTRWAECEAQPLPDGVAEAARMHLLDAIGVGLASAGSAIGSPYQAYADRRVAFGPASVFGRNEGTGPADAAMLNGGLIHSLEYDDTHTASIVHGSAVLAATALAAGEAYAATGADVLRAYALGWDVLIRFGQAAPGSFQAVGFQITSVGGALVAALIAARLMRLDNDKTVAAVGIALSQASGVFEFLSNGATVKSLHPGWAAHAGIVAAGLAEAGLTGPETSLEGRFGLFRGFARDEAAPDRLDADIATLGDVWHLTDAAFKFYPCCHYLHPFIEAAGQLAERGVMAASIEKLVCRVPEGAAGIICEPWAAKRAPASGHAARWSLPIAVAARLIDGKIDLDTFETPVSAAVRALAKRLEWEPLPGADFPRRFEAEIVCHLHNGDEQHVRVDDVYGNRSRPADPAAVLAKFRANAERSLPAASVFALETAMSRLERAHDLTELTAALRGRAEN
jgi:2-methylcitrate dehydratase PrpD